MKVYITLIKFLFLGALFIISNNQLHIDETSDRQIFYTEFNAWLDTLFEHSMQITGYVVNSQWLPQEETPPGPFDVVE